MEITRAALTRGLIFTIVSAFSMALLGILGKLGYRAGMTELELLQNRWSFGAAILFGYLFFTDRRSLTVSGHTLFKTALLGAVFQFLAGFTFFAAIKHIPVSTTLLIVYFYPVVVTLAAAYLFKQRLGGAVLLSLVLILAGSSLVFFDAFTQRLNSLGIIYALLNMIVFSGYMILAHVFLRGQKPIVMTFYMALFAGLTFSIFHNPLKILDSGVEQLIIGLALGLIPTAVSYVFNFKALEKVGSSYVSIFSTFEPVSVVIVAYLLLGEQIFFNQMLGMVLIISGIILPNLRSFTARGDSAK